MGMSKTQARLRENTKWKRRAVKKDISFGQLGGQLYLSDNRCDVIVNSDLGIDWEDEFAQNVLEHGHGTAIRFEEDTPDIRIGYMLAMGRAFVHLGEKYIKRANGLMKHHDDMKNRVKYTEARVISYDEPEQSASVPAASIEAAVPAHVEMTD